MGERERRQETLIAFLISFFFRVPPFSHLADRARNMYFDFLCVRYVHNLRMYFIRFFQNMSSFFNP